MKRILLALTLIFGTLFIFVPSASATVADCVNLNTPTVTNNLTSINAQVTITVNCSNAQLGQDGGIPRYSIAEESADTATCTGPEKLQSGLVGTIRCTIRMGTSSGSIRTGATASTIRATFRFDSSTKLAPFTHTPILQRSGGDVLPTPTPTPTAATCKVAPLAPRLLISYPDANLGPRFEFSDDPNSDIATNFYWTYSTYDSVKKEWDAWNNLNAETLVKGKGSFVFQSNLQQNKSKIAFYVYASGKCGESPRTRESQDGNGIPLAGKTINSASVKMASIGILDNVNLIDLIEVTSNTDFVATTKTPQVCLISNGKLIPVSLGNCLLSVSAPGYFNVTQLVDYGALINIVRNNQTLADFNLKPTQLGSPVTFPLKSDQGLDISPEILTSNICVLDGNSVLGIAPGTCTGALKNTGNDKLNAFSTNFKVEITKLSQSIKVNNLSKGLVIKNKVAKLDVTATSKLPVTGNNLTPSVCTFAAGELKIIGNGLCNFELVQPGDSTFSAAPKLTIKLTIANQSVKLNITCIKGKVIKSISGSNPVCPAGFKKK